ncbi:MAG: toxin TcdB middle/N-terminal domain-containing protein [Candidatus Omnitrophota bacterium]
MAAKNTLTKILSLVLAITHFFVTTLWGLDFAEAAEVAPEETALQSTGAILTSEPNTQPISPDDAATPQSSANWVSDVRVPIAFNSLQAFQTDPFTGAATFSTPIAVPPGRNNIQPNIALTYSSSGSNGICGQGWNLDLGSIERSTKKGPPGYTNSDTFIFISGGATSELVDVGSGHYRAKIEGAFMDFYFDGTYWIVKDKAGTKYYFGQTSDSRVEGSPGTFRWAIDKVADVHSNYMKISYLKHENQVYPQLIQYTGFNNDENFVNGRVEFGYSSRNDKIINNRPKFLVKTNLRLDEIIVKTADNNRVRKYYLTYGYSNTGRSLINSISQYPDNDTEILPPLTFNYQESSTGWTLTSGWNIPSAAIMDEGARIADINNDGFPDILRYKQSEEYTFLNNKTNGWQQTSDWQLLDLPDPNWDLTFWGVFGDEGLVLTDIDGDGWLDLAQHFLDARTYYGFDQNFVFPNNKTNGWQNSSIGSIPSYIVKIGGGYTEFWGTLFSDVNGDGFVDTVHAKDGLRVTWRNNNPGWTEDPSWALPDGDFRDGAELADINADGLPDLIIAKVGDRRTYINNSSNWVRDSNWDLPIGNFTDRSTQLVDVNSDGWLDIVTAKDGTRDTYINNTHGWGSNSAWNLPDGDFPNLSTRLADINADAMVDIVIYKNGTTPKVYLNNSPMPDLLIGVNNGVGGSVNLTYQPSTKFDNRDASGSYQLPFPVYVATSVTSNDGQGNSYTTTYNYAKGKYDAASREFRGFGLVQTIDAQGNVSETHFLQDDIFKGKPSKQIVKDSSGNIHSKQETIWQNQDLFGASVKFPYAAEVNNFTYNGNTSDENGFVKKTQVSNNFTIANNLISQSTTLEKGDVTTSDDSADNRSSVTNFLNNETDWLIGFANNVVIYDGSGNKVSEKWLYYDDATNYATPPSKGLLTKDEIWLHNPVSGAFKNVATTYSYNNYGQLQGTTDALNHTTTTSYEAALNTYPSTVTNAINHTIQTTYDIKTGQVLTSTDPNSQISTNIYDNFGRLAKVIGPNDNELFPAVIYEYDLATVPIKVTKHTKINNDIVPGYMTTYSFFDGVGRLIETKSPAENDPVTGMPRQIISGVVTYTQRGEVKEKYLPYFVDGENANFVTPDYSSPKITFTYDALGRLIQSTNPNLTYSSVSFSDWTTTKTDENGHSKKEYYDAYGNLIQVDEYNSGQTYTTRYEYDIKGNLIRITDNQNNVTNITYDSLGRKIAMDEPDMGQWSYIYDDVGNLTEQADAKAQPITFQYDGINRLATKVIGAKTVDYTYDEAGVQYATGRLTQVDDVQSTTQFRYDKLGRETRSIKVVNPTSFEVNRTYDALDRLISVTYPDGETVTYEYNKAGLIERVVGIKNTAQVTYVANVDYNANGQITHIEYGNGTYTDYTYNPNTFRLTNLITHGPSGTVLQDLQYQFDNVGNVTHITDNINSSSQAFVYDDLDRLIQGTGNAYGTINYTYDSIGNMTQKGALSLIYGESGAPPHAVTTVIGAEGTTNISYDSNGNMSSKGNKLFTYDKENRLTQVEAVGTASARVSINLTPGWNFFSLPVIPSDLKISSVLSRIATKYDQVSRYNAGVFEHFVKDADFNDFDSFEYGRGYQIYVTDPAGASVSISGEVPNQAPTYDLSPGWNLIGSATVDTRDVNEALNNLIYAVDYDYLARYNKDTSSYQRFYNNPATNQFSQFSKGEAYFLYSTSQKNWDVKSESFFTQFEYDGDGGRVKKITPNSTTVYVGSLFEKTDSSDSGQITEIKHIFMGSQRIASVKTRGDLVTTTYYHSDHLGSSNVLTDQNGNQIALYEYTPYGEFTQPIAQNSQPITHFFTGKELDDSTGLYFYGARYYDPEIGRFITPDSIVQAPSDPQSLNRYSYCRNNPVVYTDPSGHFLWFAAIIGAIVGATLGGISAAINHQPIWQGIVTGGISGLGAGFGLWMGIGWGAASGAGGSALMGGNPALGAGLGAFGAALGYGVGTAFKGNPFNRFIGSTLAGGIVGGIGSEISGSSFGKGFSYGAAFAAAGYALGWTIGTNVIGNYEKDRLAAIQDAFNKASDSLQVGKSDMIKLTLGKRQLGGTIPKLSPKLHEYARWEENGVPMGWEMGPDENGNIATGRNAARSWAETEQARSMGIVTERTIEVSASAWNQTRAIYEAVWVGEPYIYNNYNSNYAINSSIYSIGSSVPGCVQAPEFSKFPYRK